MDCVGCDKCRLWGKLQVTGLGTALKLLFSYDGASPLSSPLNPDHDPHAVVLSRSELVAFVNTLHRLSESLAAVDKFRSLWAHRNFKEDEQSTSGQPAKSVSPVPPESSDAATSRIGDVIPLQASRAAADSSREADAGAASSRSPSRRPVSSPAPEVPRQAALNASAAAGGHAGSGLPRSFAATIWTRLVTLCEGGWSRCVELVGRTTSGDVSDRTTSGRDEL